MSESETDDDLILTILDAFSALSKAISAASVAFLMPSAIVE